ncbi:hypothetical protein [Clostridium tunisiense]|nr:hypothetical protein [Clostridium tunisiense]
MIYVNYKKILLFPKADNLELSVIETVIAPTNLILEEAKGVWHEKANI